MSCGAKIGRSMVSLMVERMASEMKNRDLEGELKSALQAMERRGDDSSGHEKMYRATTLLEGLGIGVRNEKRRRTLSEDSEPDTPVVQTTPQLGRFEQLGELGVGGMGRGVEAFDPELGRNVAIKLIRDPKNTSDALVKRFVSEARLTAQLDHPGIVPVHELGVTADGELFFVMKKVSGRSLAELVEKLAEGDPATLKEWTRHRLLTAFIQICNALSYAHQRGVLHRDLKPENIMVGDFGEVVVMDWGVAQSRKDAAEQKLGEIMVTVGTPGYMSPEQARGELRALTPKSDVWAMGALLYELLTFKPAYEGSTPLQLMVSVVEGAPPDPRERAPERRIPIELAQICMRALDPDPLRRWTARELAQALRAHLEGSERLERAEEQLNAAQLSWKRHAELRTLQKELQLRLETLEETTPPWTPLTEKVELQELKNRQSRLIAELADTFEAVVGACERAIGHVSDLRDAHALLADAYWTRLQEADERRDAIGAMHYGGRVRAHDVGRYGALLDGAGTLTLDTAPQGAEVWCRRVERRDLVWTLGDAELLGVTPMVRRVLPMGSYVITLTMEGRRDVTYPIHLTRGSHWDSCEREDDLCRACPIEMLKDESIGTGWRYVPGGPFQCGGDPMAIDSMRRSQPWVDSFLISELPVTCAEYRDFLNALLEWDSDEAWRRVPREVSGPTIALGQYWERPEPGEKFVVPEADRDGARWDELWPITSVSWHDAMAFAAWRTSVTGQRHRLPRELEWEKAARGVDGRAFPWGDLFDATLCRMRDSHPTNKHPDVVGAYPTDVSVYGVRDLGGTTKEWCAEDSYLGDSLRRMTRGGSWLGDKRACRVASRNVLDVSYVYPSVGFRLLREAK